MKKIKNVMSKNVEVVRPESTLFEAALLMKRLDVGVLPVCDGDRLKGMITDRDLVVRGLADRKALESSKVLDVMTKDIHYCYEDQDLEVAANLMESKKVRRVVVLNRKKRLVGILSIGDLASETRNSKLVKRTLTQVSDSPSLRFFGGGSRPRMGFGSIVIGSLVSGLGYALFRQTGEVQNVVNKILPVSGQDKERVA